MDFASIVIILLTFYLRPQDWLPGMAGVNLMQPIAMFAIAALFLRRRSFRGGDMFKTPTDYLVFIYTAYILITTPEFTYTVKEFGPLILFYVVTVQGLDSIDRIERYLRWWLFALLALAAFGVGSFYGIDITGAKKITEVFGGRLALGTWMHNNPNSLGHTVILAIPVAFFLLVWRRPLKAKLLAVPLIVLAAYCVLRTESRGSFVAGLAVVTVALILGRKKIVQAIMISAVVTSATGILAVLPRMETIASLRSDEGVQGRMMAWEIARTTVRHETYGDGWDQFKAYIEFEGAMYPKATHSGYVKVAADLGYAGLFIYLAILWCGIRILAGYRAVGDQAERVRRTLVVLLAGYAVSCWMIDRGYHTEYFLLAAAISCLQRIRMVEAAKEAELVEEDPPPAEVASVRVGFTEQLESRAIMIEPAAKPRPIWNRFGFVDIAVSMVLVRLTIELWDYILRTI